MTRALPGAWFSHTNKLAPLGEKSPFTTKLKFLHDYLRERLPKIDRVAVALYHAPTDTLKTYAHSSLGADPLSRYEARLADSRTLTAIVARRQPRVINDIDEFTAARPHTQKIAKGGYGASYTLPIYRNDNFLGFIFFNSYHKGAFPEITLHHLDLVGHLLALSLIDHLSATQSLVASVRSVSALAQQRDFETGSHLDRMSHYSRLIALGIAEKYGLDDTMVEHIFLFSPLHDVGKIAIPDRILLKPGKLTEEEFTHMKEHPQLGVDMIDALLDHFELADLPQTDLLRNIALHHHEAINGAGYPHGLKGDEIPIEARVAAVADVFDALTSHRPYKHAWTNDEAFAFIAGLAGDTLDHDCVHALLQRRTEVEEIQARFAEDCIG